MEIKNTLILDCFDPLSKALPHLDETPAVIVTKNGKYYGIIDHGSTSSGLRDPHNIKCETATVRPPVVLQNTGIFERAEAFLNGHFKALPVIDTKEKPLGITTRVELLKDMVGEGILPGSMAVTEIMGSPVYTIDAGESIAKAKKAMKENTVRRLVVIRNGNIVGLVSAFDVSAWASRPNLMGSGKKDIKNQEQISFDSMRISEFFRPDITTIKQNSTVEEAAKKMIDKQVSAVVVVADNKKPLGILSALDIFKTIRESSQKGATNVVISGFGEENRHYYPYIEKQIGHIIEKFGKTFDISSLNVHVKEGKSAYTINLNVEVKGEHISLKSELNSFNEAVDQVVSELDTILRKRKDSRKGKPRVSHAL